MAFQVCMGASLQCSFGLTPGTLVVLPSGVTATTPAATIACGVPIVNVPPFGMCRSPSNPAVAAATASALGVLTPMPCVPVTTAWAPGAPTVVIGGAPALDDSSTLACSWGGVISIGAAGQAAVTVP